MMTALSLVPMLSHAAVFWDDEMEQGNTDFSAAYMLNAMIPAGIMAYDTNVKFSGTGSIRLNFPPACQTLTTKDQCGGSLTRTFPLTDNVWKRVYSGTPFSLGLNLRHSQNLGTGQVDLPMPDLSFRSEERRVGKECCR